MKGEIFMTEYRELKNRTRISTTLDNDVYKMLKEYSSKTDVPITKIFDRAITAYIESATK